MTYIIKDDPMGYARMYGYVESSSNVPSFYKEKYEADANKYWDKFYKNNSTHFFKDRHWLEREFHELVASPGEEMKKVLEVGCGVGNTTFPLLQRNQHLSFSSFDFSKVAVDHLKANPMYETYSERCNAYVYDIAKDELPDNIPLHSFDFAVIIFVLSAISPDNMDNAVKRIHRCLKQGAFVLIRDYAENDMAQQRFEAKPKSSRLDDNCIPFILFLFRSYFRFRMVIYIFTFLFIKYTYFNLVKKKCLE
eukprot:TRINITY_DN4935_c0_g1_i2.p1 TRINITY_DN4935_c0_g1~~TRINITY_DN4935_c0_g1_i2.p1  ORF type:complete len:250 (+),score=40.65 TRINITY_DN4935_c0_g1_i2:42-791(+)